MKLFLSLALIATCASATAAEIEWTYGAEFIVIASEKVKNEDCDTASCGAYAYYNTLQNLEQAVDSECKTRGYKRSVIVKTDRNTEMRKNLILTMTGLCKK